MVCEVYRNMNLTRRAFLKLLWLLAWLLPLRLSHAEEPPVALEPKLEPESEEEGLVFPMEFPFVLGMAASGPCPPDEQAAGRCQFLPLVPNKGRLE